jgi:hypothetical protein
MESNHQLNWNITLSDAKPPAPKTNDRMQSLKLPPDRPTGDPSPNSKPEEDYCSDAIQRIEEERRKAEAILDEKNDECKLLFTPRVHKMSCWDITWLTGRDITSRDDTGRGDIRSVVARHDNQRDAWQMSCWDMIGDLTGRHIASEDDAGPKDVRRIDTRHNNQRDAWQMSCWDMIGDLTGRHIASEDDAGPKDVRRIDTRHSNQRDAWQMSCWDMIGNLTGNRGDDRGDDQGDQASTGTAWCL